MEIKCQYGHDTLGGVKQVKEGQHTGAQGT
jgi:hypothetical protein